MQDATTGELVRIPEELHRELKRSPNPPPLFKVGEILEIRGGRFRIRSIGRKTLMLEGVPGTRLGGDGKKDGGP